MGNSAGQQAGSTLVSALISTYYICMDELVFSRRKAKKTRSEGSVVLKWLVSAAFISLSLFLFYNIFRSIQITAAKLEILNRAEKEVDELRVENIRLIMEKHTVQSPDYVETEARNRLNYSQEGEILFVIPDSVMNSAGEELEGILSESDSADGSKEVWRLWFDFFLLGV